MFIVNLILWLALGALAGWIAGKLMKAESNLVLNLILGVVGSLVGGLIAGLLGISTATFSLGALVIAVGGACLLIWAVRKLK